MVFAKLHEGNPVRFTGQEELQKFARIFIKHSNTSFPHQYNTSGRENATEVITMNVWSFVAGVFAALGVEMIALIIVALSSRD